MPVQQVRLDTENAIDGRQLRALAFQQVRLEYMQRTLGLLGLPAGGRAVVVGSGRGTLAKALGGLGFEVDAVDPSAAATALAEAADDGSGARYRTAPPDELGVPDGSADLVYCADTFEITDDLGAVLHEVARALRPGGVLVYDTVTRTVVSRLVYLGGFQGIPATRIMPPGRYTAARLRPPEELVPALARHGLVSGDVCSFEPQSRRTLVSAVLARRRGQITDADVPSALRFELAPGHRPVVTYLGFARKPTS
jgi:2-polyprenyl-6-hydroxyphenyl methylase / 3-demethylubiquinone-9 3-methyltransferase